MTMEGSDNQETVVIPVQGEPETEPALEEEKTETTQKKKDKKLPLDPKTRKRRLIITGSTVVVLAILATLTWKLSWYKVITNKYNAASLTVEVKDVNGQNMAGSTVALDGGTYTADGQGKVSITSLVAGDYSVKVSKTGYEQATSTVTLKRGDNGLKIISLAKQPDKTYAVEGVVQDYVSGQPVVNVQVTLGTTTIMTDPSGEYTFSNQPAGAIKLVFSKQGYSDKELDLTITNANIITTKVPLVPSGQLVFTSNRTGLRELYTVAYDGSGVRLFITPQASAEYFSPQLSPDGKHVLFQSTQDGVKDSSGNALAKLYISDPTGQNVVKVADDVSQQFSPTWSPNSQYVYFSGYTDSGLTQATHKIYTVSTVKSVDVGEAAQNISFSPDSTLLAYTVASTVAKPQDESSTLPGAPTMENVNILKAVNVINNQHYNSLAQQTPTMTNLAFTADSKSVGYEIVDSSGATHRYQVVIASGASSEVTPLQFPKRLYVPSPNGSSQAFVENRDGQTDVYIVDKNEQNEKRLTTIGTADTAVVPYWDASGNYLIFGIKSDTATTMDIVAVNGGSAQSITDYYSGTH